jgi:hypothetical protein
VVSQSEHDSLWSYPAEKAGGGVSILRQPWQRAVFIASIAGGVLSLLIALFFPGAGY